MLHSATSSHNEEDPDAWIFQNRDIFANFRHGFIKKNKLHKFPDSFTVPIDLSRNSADYFDIMNKLIPFFPPEVPYGVEPPSNIESKSTVKDAKLAKEISSKIRPSYTTSGMTAQDKIAQDTLSASSRKYDKEGTPLKPKDKQDKTQKVSAVVRKSKSHVMKKEGKEGVSRENKLDLTKPSSRKSMGVSDNWSDMAGPSTVHINLETMIGQKVQVKSYLVHDMAGLEHYIPIKCPDPYVTEDVRFDDNHLHQLYIPKIARKAQARPATKKPKVVSVLEQDLRKKAVFKLWERKFKRYPFYGKYYNYFEEDSEDEFEEEEVAEEEELVEEEEVEEEEESDTSESSGSGEDIVYRGKVIRTRLPKSFYKQEQLYDQKIKRKLQGKDLIPYCPLKLEKLQKKQTAGPTIKKLFDSDILKHRKSAHDKLHARPENFFLRIEPNFSLESILEPPEETIGDWPALKEGEEKDVDELVDEEEEEDESSEEEEPDEEDSGKEDEEGEKGDQDHEVIEKEGPETDISLKELGKEDHEKGEQSKEPEKEEASSDETDGSKSGDSASDKISLVSWQDLVTNDSPEATKMISELEDYFYDDERPREDVLSPAMSKDLSSKVSNINLKDGTKATTKDKQIAKELVPELSLESLHKKDSSEDESEVEIYDTDWFFHKLNDMVFDDEFYAIKDELSRTHDKCLELEPGAKCSFSSLLEDENIGLKEDSRQMESQIHRGVPDKVIVYRDFTKTSDRVLKQMENSGALYAQYLYDLPEKNTICYFDNETTQKVSLAAAFQDMDYAFISFFPPDSKPKPKKRNTSVSSTISRSKSSLSPTSKKKSTGQIFGRKKSLSGYKPEPVSSTRSIFQPSQQSSDASVIKRGAKIKSPSPEVEENLEEEQEEEEKSGDFFDNRMKRPKKVKSLKQVKEPKPRKVVQNPTRS